MPKKNYTYQAVKHHAGKAIHQYNMIEDGDRIAVGLSGGKDSLTMMYMLNERLARIPINYTLIAIYIDPGFEGNYDKQIENYCNSAKYQLHIEHTDYGIVAHSPENRENPCFLCARLRRKRLFEISDQLGCNKLALGHNKDDIIETLFMNMCYSGEISTMVPYQPLFKGKLTLIRPLAMLDEDLIRRFYVQQGLPGFENPCPSANASQRYEIKTFLNNLYRHNRKIKGNIFRSMSRVKKDYLL